MHRPLSFLLTLALSLPTTTLAQPRQKSEPCPGLAKRLVRAAWRTQGLGPGLETRLRSRLRWSALLPRLSARASGLHGTGLSYGLDGSGRTDGLDGRQSRALGWQVQLSWDLARLAFDARELRVLASRRRAARARQALTKRVLQLYESWRSAAPKKRRHLALRLELLTGLPSPWPCCRPCKAINQAQRGAQKATSTSRKQAPMASSR